MAVKEIVPVFYLFVWLVMYIIYQFKLTNQARSNRTFIEYISKQSWFVFVSWALVVLLSSVNAIK